MDQHSPLGSSLALSRLAEALRDREYRFTAVTPATHRRVNARAENFWARSVEDVFGWSRPFIAGVLEPGLFEIARQAGVLAPTGHAGQESWRSRVRAASLDGLVFLHAAFPTDEPDAVFFGPDTYRFAEAVARHLSERRSRIGRAVDIGCGSGAIGIALASTRPRTHVTLADISPAALAIAGVNARCAGLTNTICLQSNLFAALDGQFDLIVANPPYLVDSAARLYRHGGGVLGAALSLRILQESLGRLATGGSLLLYTGSAIMGGQDLFQAAAVEILAPSGLRFHYREVDPDVFGEELDAGPYATADRIAAVVLSVERPA